MLLLVLGYCCRVHTCVIMGLEQALLRMDLMDSERLTIIPSTELLSESRLRELEQVEGMYAQVQQFLRCGALFCIQDNDEAEGVDVAVQQRDSQVGLALLQLLVRRWQQISNNSSRGRSSGSIEFRSAFECVIKVKANDMTPGLMGLVFSANGVADISIECSQPSIRLMASITARRTAAQIKYRLNGDQLTTLRASILQPTKVELVCIGDSLQFATNIRPFFDSPSHTFKWLMVLGLSSNPECRLPVLHVQNLIVQGGLALCPGSTVQHLYLAKSAFADDDDDADLGELHCYCISMTHLDRRGWSKISHGMRCTKLILEASCWDHMMTLPDNSMLQHVSLLEVLQLSAVETPVSRNHAEKLDTFLTKFPRLKYAYESTVSPQLSEQLLAYKMLHQRQLHLADYKLLLSDKNLEPQLLGLFGVHLAIILVGYQVPDAVSRHLLRAFLVG
eukprot:TRINITY_DN3757_c0_g1_i2.p1 TRINITY_DN3757_c0_g1~~TRINITY_DN3757_c0_g1_i2.p1  ORF type:complete len:448 (+),score=65.01 TRINITY_DN3757_c0_g1_i2:238-1581(+)